jgi:hypothetical protein
MTNEEFNEENATLESDVIVDDVVDTEKVEEAVKPSPFRKIESDKEEDSFNKNLIASSKPKPNKAPSSNVSDSGTFVSPGADRISDKEKKSELSEDKVALKSTKNVHWEGVGRVYKGYNIVSKENAKHWLMRNHITLATPEEIAREFNV